jgi:hypothetical protein
MILHPEVFAKAQAEIDRVVGTDRLPDFQDRMSLPYVESLVKEVYRYGSLPLNAAPLSHAYDCVKLALPRPPRSVMPASQLLETRLLIQSRSRTSSIDKG